jgi:hypothetical protein
MVEVRFVGGSKNRSQGPRAKALSPPREKKEKNKKKKKSKNFWKKVGIQNNSNLDENSKIFKKWREIQKVENRVISRKWKKFKLNLRKFKKFKNSKFGIRVKI